MMARGDIRSGSGPGIREATHNHPNTSCASSNYSPIRFSAVHSPVERRVVSDIFRDGGENRGEPNSIGSGHTLNGGTTPSVGPRLGMALAGLFVNVLLFLSECDRA
jgi:hypothetical protein